VSLQIAILSRSPDAYSTRRLREACLGRGHSVKVLNTLSFSMAVEQGRPLLFFRDQPLGRYDAVVPRIGASITMYGTAVVRQFEQMGVFTLNSSHAISVSRDKLRTTQILSRHNLGVPPTAFVQRRGSVLAAIERVGGAPVIIKLLEGTQGIGVMLAETPQVAQAIVEALHSARQNVLIQKFVSESAGRDIRALVVGSRVVAAMRRFAVGEEFRTNVHRGGRAEPVRIEPAYERAAIHAAQILGLRVAGVDLLETRDGPQVLEVNSSPGLEGIENATGVDVADHIIEHLEEEVAFPEVDLRQRLTLKAGYGVAELLVTHESELAHRTLRDAGLRDRDVQVLSIQRGSLTIPNPRGDREVLPGDLLLCFGKSITLRGYLSQGRAPAPARRRKSRAERQR